MRRSTHTSGATTAVGHQVLANFRYWLRQFLRFSEDAATEVGITPTQHQALLAVSGFPGRDHITIGELAERLQVRHHSAVGLVNRLVAQGLMRREQGLEDRRRVFVRLTPRGERLLERLSAAHEAELRRIGPELRMLLRRLGDGSDGAARRGGRRAGRASDGGTRRRPRAAPRDR